MRDDAQRRGMHWATLTAFILLMVFACVPLATAIDVPCADYSTHLRLTGAVATGTAGMDIVCQDDLLFQAVSGQGLQILDISDPDQPALVGEVQVGQFNWGVDVAGHHAYLADYDGFLHVVDFSDPAQPQAVYSLFLPDSGSDLDIAGSYAFVATDGSGLVVVDISEPQVPSIAAVLDLPGYARDVAIQGTLAYVACGSGGLQTVDISNPLAPVRVAYNYAPVQAAGVAVAGSVLALGDQDHGIRLYDLASPAAPAYKGLVEMIDGSKKPAIQGDLVFAPGGTEGMYAIQVAADGSGEIIGGVETGVLARGVALGLDRAYVAEIGEVKVVDVSEPSSPPLAGQASVTANDMAVGDGYAFVGANWSGFQVVDLEDPDLPVVATIPTLYPTVEVVLRDDVAFAAVQVTGMMTVDVSDPENPQIISAGTPGGGAPMGIALQGDHAFLACGDYGFMSYDITRLELPVQMDWLLLDGYCHRVRLAGHYAVIAGDVAGLRVVDISDVQNLHLVATLPTTSATFDVAVAGDLAYVADGSAGLRVIDMSDPSDLQEVGKLDLGFYAYGITLQGDLAFVSTGQGMLVADISNPGAPRYLGGSLLPGFVTKIKATPDALLIAAETQLLAMPRQCLASPVAEPPLPMASPVLHQNVPNPFNPATVIAWEQRVPGPVHLTVHDVAGRLVADLAAGREFGPGAHQLTWKGQDRQGRSLPAGVYFYRLESPEGTARRSMVLLK